MSIACGSNPQARSQVTPNTMGKMSGTPSPTGKVYKAFTLDQTIISVADFTEVRCVLNVVLTPLGKKSCTPWQEVRYPPGKNSGTPPNNKKSGLLFVTPTTMGFVVYR